MAHPELLDRSEFLKRAAALGLVAVGVDALDPIAAAMAIGLGREPRERRRLS
jgi:hypothetical protein